MRPADLGCVNVSEAVRSELMITLSINRPWHHDTGVGCVPHLPDVVPRVGRIADQRKSKVSAKLYETAAPFERVVPRLHPAHIQKMAARLESESADDLVGGYFADLGPVRDEHRHLTVAFLVVLLYAPSVRSHTGRAEGGQPLRQPI